MSDICREFGISVREALRQPVDLTDEIMLERMFVRVYEKSKQDPQAMTNGEWDFLEWVNDTVNPPDKELKPRIVAPPTSST